MSPLPASTVQGTASLTPRPGVCLGVGSISSDLVSEANKESWKKFASQWFTEKIAFKLVDPIETYRQQIAQFAIATETELAKPKLLGSRAVAYFLAGQTEEALKDLDRLHGIATVERQPEIMQYRTLALAKLGKANEAKKSLTEYLKAEVPVSYKPYVEIQVAASLGETDVAEQQLEFGRLWLPRSLWIMH